MLSGYLSGKKNWKNVNVNSYFILIFIYHELMLINNNITY